MTTDVIEKKELEEKEDNKKLKLDLSKNSASFPVRFFIYQKERFPFLAHGLLIAAFTFSAVSYSRICRGAEGFIPFSTYLVGAFIAVSLFFLLRIFDEFKDKEEDAKNRPYLAVPRGLMKLSELKVIGIVTAVLQIVVLSFSHPELLPLYFIAVGYLLLMGVEFFVPKWLKQRQFLYVTSHMAIIALIDIFSSGLDWMVEGVNAPAGLGFFIAVSYMNGMVIELGRKMRAPENEESNSYTKMLGIKKAISAWIGLLFVTLLLSIAASIFAGYGLNAICILSAVFTLCALTGIFFMKNPSLKSSKYVEYAAAVWTLAMYLTLGGIPMLTKLLLQL